MAKKTTNRKKWQKKIKEAKCKKDSKKTKKKSNKVKHS